MIALFGAMLAVLGTWALLAAALIGLGLLWRAIATPRAARLAAGAPRGDDCFLAFWSGFALLLMFLQVWHLFRPINAITLAIVLVVGIVLFALHVPGLVRPVHGGTVLLLGLLALWIANRAIGPGNAQDSGLYHYQAIRWANTYPVVTGIGNLSAALGLNNVSFLHTAMLEAGPWHGRSNHLANGLLLLVFLGGVAVAGTRIWRGASGNRAADAYLLTLLPIAVYLALGKDVPSPKTDLPVGLMTFVCGWLALRLLSEDSNRRFRLLTLALLCAAAICLKFSSIVVVSLIGLVALAAWLRRDRPGAREAMGTVAACAIFVALLFCPWVARNVIMTGYPLFPSKVAAVEVEWRVPEPAVDDLVGSIRNQAKAGLIIWAYENLAKTPLRPYAELMKPPWTDRDEVRGLEWVRPWLFSLPVTSAIEVVLPAGIALIAWVILLARRARARGRGGAGGAGDTGDVGGGGGAGDAGGGGGAAWLMLPVLAGVGFWLWAGPEPRYGWQTIWALAAVSVALAALATTDAPSPRPGRAWVVLAILLCLPGVAYRMGVLALARDRNPLTEIPFQPPGPDHGFHPEPVQTWTMTRTRWGTEIYIPTIDQHPLSWDGPLPAAAWPGLDRDLRLRRAGDLAGGFVIDRGGR